MEIKKLIKKMLSMACICFTVITAVYMLIMQITYVDETVLVEADRVLLFFVFSLLFAIAAAVLSFKKLHSALRYVIHFLICVFGFYTCFLLPTGMRDSFMITGVVIFTICYVGVMAIIGLFKSRLKANREDSIAYTNQFKHKK